MLPNKPKWNWQFRKVTNKFSNRHSHTEHFPIGVFIALKWVNFFRLWRIYHKVDGENVEWNKQTFLFFNFIIFLKNFLGSFVRCVTA